MMFTAKVKDGRLVVDPVVDLPEGTTVTVLDDAIADADRAGWIPAEQVIAELRRR
jgi:hypothetical protein